jgi:hypothetical protein
VLLFLHQTQLVCILYKSASRRQRCLQTGWIAGSLHLLFRRDIYCFYLVFLVLELCNRLWFEENRRWVFMRNSRNSRVALLLNILHSSVVEKRRGLFLSGLCQPLYHKKDKYALWLCASSDIYVSVFRNTSLCRLSLYH